MVFLDQLYFPAFGKKAATACIDLLCKDALADSERLTDDCGRTTLIVERTNRNGFVAMSTPRSAGAAASAFASLVGSAGACSAFLQAPSAAIIRRLTKRLRANFMGSPLGG